MALKSILCGLLKGSSPNLLYANFVDPQESSLAFVTGISTASNATVDVTTFSWESFAMENIVSPSPYLMLHGAKSSLPTNDFFFNSSPVSAAPKSFHMF